MRCAGVIVITASFLGLVLTETPGRASLHSPDDRRFIIPVGPDGKGRPLEFEEFKRRLATVMNAMDPRTKANGKVNSDRETMLGRIEKRSGKKLTAAESAALTADLIRVGHLDDALNQIKPHVLGRNPSYLALTTLAHVYAARGDWREAVDYQLSAILDAEMPVEVNGLSKPQRDWIAMLDRDYVLPYFQHKLRDAKSNPASEDVAPLFPIPQRNAPHDPVRFVNESGVFQAGALAAAQRAKLPTDAIAITQQMLLWFPSDTRLYWLLAELYAAEGQFGPARAIMDESVSESRQFGNRKLLVDHRASVREADDRQPRTAAPDEQPLGTAGPASAAPPQEPEPQPISMRTIWIYFGVIGAIGMLALIRAIGRRARGGACGPVG